MAQGVSLKSEQTIAQFDGPKLGILRDLPFDRIPVDGLWDGQDVVWREGSLQVRPGLTQHDATNLGAGATGALSMAVLGQAAFQTDTFQNDSFQAVLGTLSSLIVAATKAKIWAYYSGTWNDITGTALTAGDANLARMTSIAVGGTNYILISNGVDGMQQWDIASATASAVAGSPPKFNDLTTTSGRIVGILWPYTIQWGNALVINTWPSANQIILSDTPDGLIAVRNLGTLGAVIYKQRTLWTLIPQGGLDSAYFRYEFKGWFDGPAGPAAIADADGVQYWMTTTGRIGAFDGTSQQWIGEGLYPFLRTDVDQANMGLAFAVYEPLFREVHFHYPRSGDSGAVKGLVIVTLPKPDEALAHKGSFFGIGRHGIFRGVLSVAVSAGVDLRTGTNKALVFGNASGNYKSYTQEGVDDTGTNFSGQWQTGVQEAPGRDVYHLGGIETSAERGAGYGTLTVAAVTSLMLDKPGGTVSTGTSSVDLTKTPYHPDVVPSQQQGRYFGLKYSFTTPVTLRYRGARCYRSAPGPQPQAVRSE